MNQNSKLFLIRVSFLGILILLGASFSSFGQTKTEKIDKLMKTYKEYGLFNGSVLVAEKGKVIFKKGYGMANMEWDIPNKPNTKHRLGSVSKQFTSMLILQLAEQNKLKLDVSISKYLPDYPKKTGNKITIHHLLTHTSGIPNYTAFPGFFKNKSRDPYTPDKFVTVFADSALDFKPGERFAYSNSGYFLLGVIIEKVSGKSYEQVLQENILSPLKMNNTGYDHHTTILKNRATGYERAGDTYINSPYLDMSIPYAAGSLYSTVEDLFLWDQALYKNKLLSKKYMDLLFKPHVAAFGAHYAYGWGVRKTAVEGVKDSILLTRHGGGINGFNTLIKRIVTHKNLIVLLNNTGGAQLNKISQAISSILYNIPYEMPQKSLAKLLMDVIIEKGLSPGLKKFKELKDSKEYSVKENEMNAGGYQLLQAGKVKEAIAVFKLNTEEFPKSSNAYDSLGEAYLTDGNKELAVKNYKKSLELNPKNNNAIEVLKKIKSEKGQK